MKTNIQNLTVGELQSNSLKPSESLNLRLQIANKVRETIEKWDKLDLKIAKEAIRVSNQVDSIVSMTDKQIQEAERVSDLAKTFWIYWKKILELIEKENNISKSPFSDTIKNWVADDYDYMMTG